MTGKNRWLSPALFTLNVIFKKVAWKIELIYWSSTCGGWERLIWHVVIIVTYRQYKPLSLSLLYNRRHYLNNVTWCFRFVCFDFTIKKKIIDFHVKTNALNMSLEKMLFIVRLIFLRWDCCFIVIFFFYSFHITGSGSLVIVLERFYRNPVP